MFAFALIVGGAFVAGVAVGKTTKDPKFITKSDAKWDELAPGGPKIANLAGDYKKGAYIALVTLPSGSTQPLQAYSSDVEAVQITGTTGHWLKGEDSSKARKMPPGSYWLMPAKQEHVSTCDKGTECLMVMFQKTKREIVPAAGAGSGSGSGSATKK